jgi:hypothetical protein
MEEVMESTGSPGGRQAGPWVVELKIAGCTIRRRAAKRRNLLGLPGARDELRSRVGDLQTSGLA